MSENKMTDDRGQMTEKGRISDVGEEPDVRYLVVPTSDI